MGELMRAQELRVDEFSVQQLIESLVRHKCKSCKRGWIAWTIPKNFKMQNRITLGFFTFPVNKQSFQVHVLCWASTDGCLLLDTWNLSEPQANFFCQSTPYVQFITDTLSNDSSLYEYKCHRKYRETCCKSWKTNWEYDYNASVWKKAVIHEFFCHWKFHEFFRQTAKNTDVGASVW